MNEFEIARGTNLKRTETLAMLSYTGNCRMGYLGKHRFIALLNLNFLRVRQALKLHNLHRKRIDPGLQLPVEVIKNRAAFSPATQKGQQRVR